MKTWRRPPIHSKFSDFFLIFPIYIFKFFLSYIEIFILPFYHNNLGIYIYYILHKFICNHRIYKILIVKKIFGTKNLNLLYILISWNQKKFKFATISPSLLLQFINYLNFLSALIFIINTILIWYNSASPHSPFFRE